MFSPVQIKHECTNVEDVNTSNRIGSSGSTIYPVFINQDVDYKHQRQFREQFWEQTQLSNEVPVKNEIHDQQAMFQVSDVETAGTLPYMKDYIQNTIFFQINQEDHGNDQIQMNNQSHHQDASNVILVEDNRRAHSSENPSQDARGCVNQALTSQSSTVTKNNNRLGRPSKITAESSSKKLKCQCEICFKEFGHKSNLFIHMRTHNGERPYKCNQCDKCFTHSGNLAIHMRTHSGERPYGCQICGKMFSHSGNLSTHLRTHSGVKPYKCSVCAKEFRHSGNLSIHERIHSGIKPFHCKICGKEFYHSGNLTTHMKKHPTNATDCENDQKQLMHGDADNGNNTVSSDYINNVSLLDDEVKSVHGTSNVVPIKNESTENPVLGTIGILTPTSS